MNLPEGWFTDEDIRVYREIYRTLVPHGGRTAEIGIYRGRSLCSVADIIIEKDLEVHCVDLFQPYLGDPATDLYERFIETATRFKLLPHLKIHEAHSIDAAATIAPRSLDFAFIDADHSYEAVRDDLVAWEKLIKAGGYIGGHDYGNEGNLGVVEAVVERYGHGTKVGGWIWLKQITEMMVWRSDAPQV